MLPQGSNQVELHRDPKLQMQRRLKWHLAIAPWCWILETVVGEHYLGGDDHVLFQFSLFYVSQAYISHGARKVDTSLGAAILPMRLATHRGKERRNILEKRSLVIHPSRTDRTAVSGRYIGSNYSKIKQNLASRYKSFFACQNSDTFAHIQISPNLVLLWSRWSEHPSRIVSGCCDVTAFENGL